jgi:beta-glucuronidase
MVPRPFTLPCIALCCTLAVPMRATPGMLNAYSRPGLDLDGKWHVIVDPYENGYYDYRHQPYDARPEPDRGLLPRPEARRQDRPDRVRL